MAETIDRDPAWRFGHDAAREATRSPCTLFAPAKLVTLPESIAATSPEASAAPSSQTVGASRQTAAREEPEVAYLGLAGAYITVTAGTWLWLRRHRHIWPKPGFFDLVLLGLATARLSRLITRDKIMRPVRAPLTAAEIEAGGELKEHAKGSGLVRAAGELLTCPRCTAVWAASGLALGFFASPASARFAGLLLSSSLISDFVNRSFALLNEVNAERRNQLPQPDKLPRGAAE